MSMSRWDSDPQGEMWIPSEEMPRSPGHPFYMKLNQVLSEEEFDRKIEEICAPFYKEGGRPSIPLGVYFRMLLAGYFEGIDSQRGIAWRCADSLSLREFLGLALSERTPDHSSLTRIRKRLSLDAHEQMFSLVLAMAHKRGLLRGKTVLVDATTLEANAAMRSIVRKDTGEDWNEYLTRLAKADGIEEPTAEDLQRYDTKRKGKKVSNKDWRSKTDPDARIAKMKDGRTHMAYKAEHVVDADSGLIIAAAIEPAGSSDAETIKSRLIDAQASLLRAGSEQVLEEAVGDKGYHKLDTLAWTAELGIRTYLPEKQQRGKRDWNNYTAAQKRSYHNNRRRTKGPRGRRLLRLRGEPGFVEPRKHRSITPCARWRSTSGSCYVRSAESESPECSKTNEREEKASMPRQSGCFAPSRPVSEPYASTTPEPPAPPLAANPSSQPSSRRKDTFIQRAAKADQLRS